jgi:hypothetical protein
MAMRPDQRALVGHRNNAAAQAAAQKQLLAHTIFQAYSHAAAAVEATDALRPNAYYGLHATPNALGTQLTALTATPATKITIEAQSTIVGVYSSKIDEDNGVVLTSLKFGANETVKAPPMQLAAMSDHVLRSDRLIALIGHRLPSALDVNCTFFLCNAANQYLRGIGLYVIDGTCRPVAGNASPAPGFAGFQRVVPAIRKVLRVFGNKVPIR